VALPAFDTFLQTTGAAQNLPTYNPAWSIVEGSNTWSVPSGAGYVSAPGSALQCVAMYDGGEAWGADHEAIVELGSASLHYRGPATRLTANSGYHIDYTVGDTTIYFTSRVGGVSSNPAGTNRTLAAALAAGDFLKLRSVDDTHQVFYALAAAPSTWIQVGADIVDADNATGKPGMAAYTNSSDPDTIRYWSADNVSAGGTTLALGLAQENDTALAVQQPPTFTRATEADSALDIFGITSAIDGDLVFCGDTDDDESAAGGLRLVGGYPDTVTTLALGLAQENDTALAVARGMALAVGLAQENDTALPLVRLVQRAITLASEADSALALGRSAQLAIALASEADSALGLGCLVQLAVALASESNTALAINRGSSLAVQLAAETDAALAVLAPGLFGVAPATEGDTALQLGRGAQLAVSLAAEADSALAVARGSQLAVALASEADTAQALGRGVQLAVSLAAEADTAPALFAPGQFAIGPAQEADQALQLVAPLQLLLGLAVENDTAPAVLQAAQRAIQPAQEADSALLLVRRTQLVVGLAAEAESATALITPTLAAVGLAVDAESALPITPGALRVMGLALEIDTAPELLPQRALAWAWETDAAPAFTNPDFLEPLMPPPLASTVMYATALAYVARFGLEETALFLADEEQLLTPQLLEDVLRGTWTGTPSQAQQNAAIAAQARLERQIGISSNFMDGYLRSAASLPLAAGDANAGTLEECCLSLVRFALADDDDNATERMDKTAESWRKWLVDVSRGTVQLVGASAEAAPSRGRVRSGQMKSGFNWGGFGQ